MLANMLDNFVYFINERESIRLRKRSPGRAKGIPLTQDSVLAEWRFCNVNRCDDRETRWIFKNVVKPNAGSSMLWFNLIIARFVNWSPTLAELGFFHTWEKSDQQRFCSVMARRADRGEKVYTGAYMIRAGTGDDAKMPKAEYLVNRVFNGAWSAYHEAVSRGTNPVYLCRDWDALLGRVFGMGDFMRNQIITDYKYTQLLPTAYTHDWTTFVLAGPGTQRGLNRLYGRRVNQGWKVEESQRSLAEVRKVILSRFEHDGRIFHDLNNLSNCFCEWDKYRRVIEGQGTPRSRYKPSPEPLP